MTFTSMIVRNTSSVVSAKRLRWEIPALQISTSIRPIRSFTQRDLAG